MSRGVDVFNVIALETATSTISLTIPTGYFPHIKTIAVSVVAPTATGLLFLCYGSSTASILHVIPANTVTWAYINYDGNGFQASASMSLMVELIGSASSYITMGGWYGH